MTLIRAIYTNLKSQRGEHLWLFKLDRYPRGRLKSLIHQALFTDAAHVGGNEIEAVVHILAHLLCDALAGKVRQSRAPGSERRLYGRGV